MFVYAEHYIRIYMLGLA